MTGDEFNGLKALEHVLNSVEGQDEGHCQRVTAFTIEIARHMGLPTAEVRDSARGAYLHTIGKTAFPDELLHKSSNLTAAEIELLRQHCLQGHQMLSQHDFLMRAAEIVYAQAEHYDGTGYPRGLKGDQIPVGASILAVAHALDIITSADPARWAESLQEAFAEIHRGAGKKFDPEVVKVFLKMPEGVWKDLSSLTDPPDPDFPMALYA